MADELDFTINANMHSAFKREVRRLHVGLKSANLSDPPAVAGLQRRYQFFSDTLHRHHEGEDEYLWPVALKRATPQESVILNTMTAEHHALQSSLEQLDTDLEALGPDCDIALVGRHFDTLLAVLQGHCTHEERDAVPVLQKYLTREDMKGFITFTRQQKDSDLVLAWVCDGATPTEVETTWAMLPSFVRLFVKPMTTRKYDRFTQECGV